MAKKIKLGDYNRLRIVKKVDFGLYLDGGDEGEILLPSRYVPEDAGIGDELDVFIYLDQDERLIATTETPLAKVGDFAYLEVKWVNEYGAFLGWGLMKDIFCPFREQKKRMVLGNSYIVHIHIDEESYRIVASAKIERYLNEDHPHYKHGDEVDLLIWQKTERSRRHLRAFPREQEGLQACHWRPLQEAPHHRKPDEHPIGRIRQIRTIYNKVDIAIPKKHCPPYYLFCMMHYILFSFFYNSIQYAPQITYQIKRKINQRKLLTMTCLDLIYRIRL